MKTGDATYVAELLNDAPAGMDRAAFMAFARHDINQGYGLEVLEAWQRYEMRAKPRTLT